MALTTKKQKALAALLSQPTHKQAAAVAGISERLLRDYLSDPEFKQEYRSRLDQILNEATQTAKRAMTPAVQTLVEICTDTKRSDTVRIAAARSIIDAGLRLHDAVEVSERLDNIEKQAAERGDL